jgi:hypothetical protein
MMMVPMAERAITGCRATSRQPIEMHKIRVDCPRPLASVSWTERNRRHREATANAPPDVRLRSAMEDAPCPSHRPCKGISIRMSPTR